MPEIEEIDEDDPVLDAIEERKAAMAGPEHDKIVADLRRLHGMAKRENTRDLLEKEISTREAKRQNEENKALRMKSTAPPPVATPPPPPPVLKRETVEASAPVFSKISKYAWDQGKKFVKVYVTLKGIEGVPDDQIVFDAQATSLCFEVKGLPPPGAVNQRLSCTLHSEVDPAGCSWARKADSMVLLKLRKAVEGGPDWGSLDDSAVKAAAKKAQDLENNKGKSTQELLSKMYADADDEGKASLAAAWESGRAKREGRA